MKLLVMIAILFSTAAISETIITVEGRGSNWGHMADDDAKDDAIQIAAEKCNGEAEQIGNWELKVLNHKEGMLYVSAVSQFKCL